MFEMKYCIYRIDGQCKLANALLASIDIPAEILCKDDALRVCSTCKCPHTYNHMVASLAYSKLSDLGLRNTQLAKDLIPIIKSGQECNKGSATVLGEGVGTVLHEICKRKGWDIELDCTCMKTIRQMNKGGPQYCRDNSTEIAKTMVEEYQRRNPIKGAIVPEWFLGKKGEELIYQAIKEYENDIKKVNQLISSPKAP